MGLSNEFSCEAWSFSCHCNPHRCFQSEVLRLYFPALKLWVVRSVSLWLFPPGECGTAQSASHHLARSTSHSLVSSWLPVSAPPTGLDECFSFISLVVRLPYSSIFCHFSLFLFFNLLLFFFWLCEEAQCVYLSLHLGWKLTFKSFIHFEFILVCDIRRWSSFNFLHVSLIFPTPFIE